MPNLAKKSFHLQVLTTITFCFGSILINAQSNSDASVIVFTKPKNAIVKIGDKKIEKQGEVFKIPAGKYQISAWAPETNLLTDSIGISSDKINIIKRQLSYSDEYLAYLKQKRKIIRPLKMATIGSGILILSTSFQYVLLKKQKNKTEDAYQDYYEKISINNIQNYFAIYESEKSSYNKKRKNYNTLLTASSVLVPCSIIYSYFHYKKRRKPFTSSKVLLSGIEPIIDTKTLASTKLGFKLKF